MTAEPIDDPVTNVRLDENTLFKVHEALKRELGFTDRGSEEVIRALLNNGILFREPIRETPMQEERNVFGEPTEEERRQQDQERILPGRPTSPILAYFEYDHLPPHLRDVSGRFYHLAHQLETTLTNGPEKSVALRKLLESKDAAVRAAL